MRHKVAFFCIQINILYKKLTFKDLLEFKSISLALLAILLPLQRRCVRYYVPHVKQIRHKRKILGESYEEIIRCGNGGAILTR